MNDIHSQVNPSVIIDAKNARRSAEDYAAQILKHLRTGVPYSVTFVDAIPRKHEREIEAELKKRFEIWANSWIAPLCRQIIAKKLR